MNADEAELSDKQSVVADGKEKHALMGNPSRGHQIEVKITPHLDSSGTPGTRTVLRYPRNTERRHMQLVRNIPRNKYKCVSSTYSVHIPLTLCC